MKYPHHISSTVFAKPIFVLTFLPKQKRISTDLGQIPTGRRNDVILKIESMSKEHSTTIRYSDADLAEFKELILKKMAYAKSDLDFYLDSLKEMSENPDNKVKGLDDGSSSAEVTRLNTLASRQQKLIKHLENALQRVESKTYGVCRESGALIAKERLRAVPHATLSVEAKMSR